MENGSIKIPYIWSIHSIFPLCLNTHFRAFFIICIPYRSCPVHEYPLETVVAYHICFSTKSLLVSPLVLSHAEKKLLAEAQSGRRKIIRWRDKKIPKLSLKLLPVKWLFKSLGLLLLSLNSGSICIWLDVHVDYDFCQASKWEYCMLMRELSPHHSNWVIFSSPFRKSLWNPANS